MINRQSIQNKVIELQNEIDRLNGLLEDEQAIPVVCKVAELAHSISCRWNHTDGCGWFYETDADYMGRDGSRHRYYVKATNILRDEDPDTVVRILSKFQDNR